MVGQVTTYFRVADRSLRLAVVRPMRTAISTVASSKSSNFSPSSSYTRGCGWGGARRRFFFFLFFLLLSYLGRREKSSPWASSNTRIIFCLSSSVLICGRASANHARSFFLIGPARRRARHTENAVYQESQTRPAGLRGHGPGVHAGGNGALGGDSITHFLVADLADVEVEPRPAEELAEAAERLVVGRPARRVRGITTVTVAGAGCVGPGRSFS